MIEMTLKKRGALTFLQVSFLPLVRAHQKDLAEWSLANCYSYTKRRAKTTFPDIIGCI